MPWARASSLHRHMECTAASYLPRLDRGKWSDGYMPSLHNDKRPLTDPPEGPTAAADWGTAMHLAKADREAAAEPFASMWDPYRVNLYPPNLGRHEVALSYDCATGAIERGPSNRPTSEMDAWKNTRAASCVVGTCDWLGVLPSGVAWVDDLKTGWQIPDVVTPQTLFYGLVASKLTRVEECQLSITHWPKRSREPTRENLWYKVGPLALLSFESELQEAWKRMTSRVVERPGPWCKYCPSASVCSKAGM